MTPQKIISVAEYYQEVLRDASAEAQRMSLIVPVSSWNRDQDLNHLLNTANRIPSHLAEGKMGKANRHLGWLQRGMSMRFGYPLEHAMDLNKHVL